MCRCHLTAAAKIKVPDRGVSSFLGDADYYSLRRQETQGPPKPASQEASPGQQPQKLEHQMHEKVPS